MSGTRLILAAVVAAIVAAFLPAATQAQPCRSAACSPHFPADAGMVNVRDFGAKGDGRTDDTAALTAAVTASGTDTGVKIWHDRVVFLPAGTYLVSDTIVKRYADGSFASGMVLVGEGVDRTLIRLADGAPGFADPRKPRGVVMTTSKRLDTATNRDYVHLGEGNDAYENFVEALTIDVGDGNPGAIGIDYLANNIGAVRDVLIRAHAGSGAIGLAMLRKWPGPALVQRVTIEGFDVGVDVSRSEYGMTLSQLRLVGQRSVGLRNGGNAIAAEDLSVTDGAGTGIVNAAPGGLIVLVGGALGVRGGTVENHGTIVFRGTVLPAGVIPSLAAGAASGWLGADRDWHRQPSGSPVPHAPIVDPGPVIQWVGATGEPDAGPPADDTAKLQAALNSGAGTIYLRHGTFWISAPVEIPASVHRIIGMNASIQPFATRQPGFTRTVGMLRILAAGTPLEIERLALDNSDRGAQVAIENAAGRVLMLRDILSIGVTTLDRQRGGGTAFLEDTCCGALKLAGAQPVVARQFNTEGGGIRITNDGTPLTILGLKSEQNCTVVDTRAGGRTEILGGLLYMVNTPAPDLLRPAFVTDNAQLSASFVEEVQRPTSHYDIYVSDTQGGEKHDIQAAAMPARGLGRLVPMLTVGEQNGR